MFLAVWAFPKLRNTTIWSVSFCVASLGLASFVGFDLMQFLSAGGLRSEAWRRALFVVITTIDFPMVALVLGCGINWVYSWRSSSPLEVKNSDSKPAQDSVEGMTRVGPAAN